MKNSETGCTTIHLSALYLQATTYIINVNSIRFPLLTPPQIGSHEANENLRKVQALGTKTLL